MPPKKCVDPDVLGARKKHRREMGRIRMRKHRAKGKELVTEMLGTALKTVCSSTDTPTGESQSLASRTAQAILKTTLLRHGVTQDRIVRVVSEGLESIRVTGKGHDISSQPDMQHRLRASDTALKLLERAGEVPGARHSEPLGTIRVNVLVLSDQPTQKIKTISAEKKDE
jgi:hypothetical protein